MTTVLFVHGINVRRLKYEKDFLKVKKALQDSMPTLKVEPCLWGDAEGAKLHHQGQSIPHYDTTGGDGQATQEEIEIELWGHLYADPLYELRVLAISSEAKQLTIGGVTVGDELDGMILNLQRTSPQLLVKLQEAEIEVVFKLAWRHVYDSKPYRRVRQKASTEIEMYQVAVARAIVAEAIALADQEVTLLYNAVLRDEVVNLVAIALGYTSVAMGLKSWAVAELLGIGRKMAGIAMTTVGTSLISSRRGTITDDISPIAGDVLVYQAHGEGIRRLVQMRIEEVEEPVVLLAHSLGGVACVDLLVEKDLRERVKLLITVGSQAPYFYEIGALHSLRFDQPLPEHFPNNWVNLYDLSDFLSYIGEKVFPQRVHDFPVKSRQPFPQSHGAYWDNNPKAEAWEIIIKAIQNSVS